MTRDLLHRPPLRASQLPPGQVRLYPGEPRAVACPDCGRWLVPHDGGLRPHMIDADSATACAQAGRRVWFDLDPVHWAARLQAADRDARTRRGSRPHASAQAPVAPPLPRIARPGDFAELRTSGLDPRLLRLQPGIPPALVCPGCGTWQRIPRRGGLAAHRAAGGPASCPGSGRTVVIDLTPGEWLTRLRAAGPSPHRP